jgi:uncharacterized OB-fold protein
VSTTDYSIPPQPAPDVDSEGFWRATAGGHLALCRCQNPECRRWLQPPVERCRRCAGPTDWEPVAGTGAIYSFIVVRQPSVPGYLGAGDLPYAVALVELDEQPGLRLPARLVDVTPEAVRVGLRVVAHLEPLSGGDYTVAVFAPDPTDADTGAPAHAGGAS